MLRKNRAYTVDLTVQLYRKYIVRMDPRPVFRTQIRKGIILVRYGSSRQRCQAKAHERDLESILKVKQSNCLTYLKKLTFQIILLFRKITDRGPINQATNKPVNIQLISFKPSFVQLPLFMLCMYLRTTVPSKIVNF